MMWNNTLLTVPENGELVWIRKEWFSFYPAVCTYDADNFTFTVQGSDIVIDAIDVARWKSKTVPVGFPLGIAKIGQTLIVG